MEPMIEKFTTTNPARPYGLRIDGNEQEFVTDQKRSDYLEWWHQVNENNIARAAQSRSYMAAAELANLLRHYEGEAIMAASRQRDQDRGISAAQRLNRANHRSE